MCMYLKHLCVGKSDWKQSHIAAEEEPPKGRMCASWSSSRGVYCGVAGWEATVSMNNDQTGTTELGDSIIHGLFLEWLSLFCKNCKNKIMSIVLSCFNINKWFSVRVHCHTPTAIFLTPRVVDNCTHTSPVSLTGGCGLVSTVYGVSL